MSATESTGSHRPQFHYDRYEPGYRESFQTITEHMHRHCPVAWTDNHDGYWVAAGNREVFELARCPHVSNDRDVEGVRRGYRGITIPSTNQAAIRNGILEMDDPEHRELRSVLNPYLSPAAVQRWIPFVDELVRAALDEKIRSGRIDFVDDLANIVPAVLTLAMLGIPLRNWAVYSEPAHATVYTPPDSPEYERVHRLHQEMGLDMYTNLVEIREHPRPGLVHALATEATLGGKPLPDIEILGMLGLLIGGGFDTTTALTAHSLEWLSEHRAERETLSRERDDLLDSATEEFLRYFTPAPGDGRTFTTDIELAGARFAEGERLWLSWAMANRDPAVFEQPDAVVLDRKGNRHFSFGLGIHRCIGSNVARAVYKRMLLAVLDRIPDFRCIPEETVHYETVAVIQGMRHLPATFTPGEPLGPGLAETLEKLQTACDEQRLAEPVTVRKDAAQI
ncbi:cytochrome P450 [Nocardia speluncae]|uniref:Cytochrome P450 n=1 Tax=Nocardia speluncae TaxID=419477 RepID=A0A846XDR2_9NOCA|nr:cytochrome P450 [Nocardia speluncae]NKY33527.1 cytochrome P450 [Nocardia speluncae]